MAPPVMTCHIRNVNLPTCLTAISRNTSARMMILYCVKKSQPVSYIRISLYCRSRAHNPFSRGGTPYH